MPRKKIIKFTKKNLTICPHCGKRKLKDERIVSEERLALVNENIPQHSTEEIKLK